MSKNQSEVVCIKGLSPSGMIRLSARRTKSTYGYWNLYPAGKKWSARIGVRACKPVPILLADVRHVSARIMQKLERQRRVRGEDFRHKRSLNNLISKWSISDAVSLDFV